VPVAAVVLTLEPWCDPRVLRRLTEDPRLVVGTALGARVPVVVDTATAAEGAALLDDIGAREGIAAFDVVSIDLLDEEPEDSC
jgi:hypothetical protein